LIGPAVNLASGQGLFSSGVLMTGGDDGLVTTSWVANTLYVASFACARSSILGWAQNTAADGATTTIICAGFHTLPATQVFGGGKAFDQRNLPVFGAIGTIGGSTALLGGLS
jgi:hypothetical protein